MYALFSRVFLFFISDDVGLIVIQSLYGTPTKYNEVHLKLFETSLLLSTCLTESAVLCCEGKLNVFAFPKEQSMNQL